MLVTRMNINTEIPDTATLLKLEKTLKNRFKRAGFISDVNIKTRSSIKIGLHMKSFCIDTLQLGHNADYGYSGSRCKAGYKKTNTPTWSQREEFNHIVNDVFDEFKISARIMSGPFLVRSLMTGRVNQWSSMQGYFGGDRLFEIKALP